MTFAPEMIPELKVAFKVSIADVTVDCLPEILLTLWLLTDAGHGRGSWSDPGQEAFQDILGWIINLDTGAKTNSYVC